MTIRTPARPVASEPQIVRARRLDAAKERRPGDCSSLAA
jgi:hypothetical protein